MMAAKKWLMCWSPVETATNAQKVVMFQDELDFTSLVSHQSDSWGYSIHARKRLSAQKTASANELMNR